MGALLHTFEDGFPTVRRDVEVGSKVGQLSLHARLQIDDPQIFVLNLPA
jgi:hypothetical protein